jgi:SPOR domain
MIHPLRHIAFRLWITVFIGGLCSLWMLPGLQAVTGLEAVPILAAAFLAALFVAVGWTTNRCGLGRVHRLLRYADVSERQGLHAEAEDAFQTALALLDSVLIAPGARRGALFPLAARMARFYLSQTRLSPAAEDFLSRYLSANPSDEEAAEQWVQHAEQQGGLHEEHQDLAAWLGEAHPGNEAIQHGLARLYLMLERTDYPALICYQRVCGAEGRAPDEFCDDLARLLRKEGRWDEWSRRIYRQAAWPPPEPAERHTEADADRARSHIEEASALESETPMDGGEAQADPAFRMSAGGAELEDDAEEGRPWPLSPRERRMASIRRLKPFAVTAGQKTVDELCRLAAGARDLLRSLAQSTRARTVLSGLLMAAVVGAGAWLISYTIELIPQAPETLAPAEQATLVPPAVADPYTLQVAAYLRQEYALKLMEDLKRQGLDAYYTETTSGGKRWYQVRISHFPDQQSAREFGRNLKWKGLVDDFYVTNYVR